MTKTCKINGKEIKIDEGSPRDTLISLLGVLSDKEEPIDILQSGKLIENNLKEYFKEELKKEEWKPCTCPKGATDCDKCDGIEWVKQSTSLKDVSCKCCKNCI